LKGPRAALVVLGLSGAALASPDAPASPPISAAQPTPAALRQARALRNIGATCGVAGPIAALGGTLLLSARPGDRAAGAIGGGLGIAGVGCAVAAWPLLLGAHATGRQALPGPGPTPGRALRWIGVGLAATTVAASWVAIERNEPIVAGMASVAYVGTISATWLGTNATLRTIDRPSTVTLYASPTPGGVLIGASWNSLR